MDKHYIVDPYLNKIGGVGHLNITQVMGSGFCCVNNITWFHEAIGAYNAQLKVENDLYKNKLTKEMCEDINEHFFKKDDFCCTFKLFEYCSRHFFYYGYDFEDEIKLRCVNRKAEYISKCSFVFNDFGSARRLCKIVLYLYNGMYYDFIQNFLFK